ncbi:phage major tail tube protein [Roseospira marina]|uniref:Phage major tail tube protein n=1 Tax=Roseospira marina TaxID=140057 RepID=A0A5M6IEX8_9PROT|nr:phage major tail tube protein [Roseospira marina]KAA5606834.1 phage major tail tube protein [Roseospira marina]MBB4313004.1 hypothetical protein [Roseospira marina]MBB5086223.1 hypothetical protein [Roseospira marina]
MALRLPTVVHKMNLFVDGQGYAGQLDEVTLPKLTIKTADYRSGGLDAPVEIDLGMEKLEIGFVVAGVDADLFRSFGVLGRDGVPLTLRGGLTRQGGSDVQSVALTLRGTFRELDLGTWKPGELTTLTVAGSLTYYKVAIAGAALVEIDVLNMVRMIDGTDQLAALRDAIGM